MASREFYEQLGSSQDLAVERARHGVAPGHRVVARRQTAGRGRLARRWASPDGGLYLSWVAGPPPAAGHLLSLAAGVELADALAASYGVATRLKWPNDVVVRTSVRPFAKLAGILVDRVADPRGRPVDVVGVGLNAFVPPGGWDAIVAPRAVALSELTDGRVDLLELEELAADAFARARANLDGPAGAAEELARCRARLYGVGRPVAVDGRPAGHLTDLAEDGGLVVLGDDGPATLRAGEVTILEAEG